MGAWGGRPFDNDDAADWLLDLWEGDDLAPARSAFERVIGATDVVEHPLASEAIGAATIVAGSLGLLSDLVPNSAALWIERVRPEVTDRDRSLGSAAMARIVGNRSELRDLHEEVGATELLNHVEALREALDPARGPLNRWLGRWRR